MKCNESEYRLVCNENEKEESLILLLRVKKKREREWKKGHPTYTQVNIILIHLNVLSNPTGHLFNPSPLYHELEETFADIEGYW